MNKLRTIIRLYTDRVGLRAISELARTPRNTVKKYVTKWNTRNLSYEKFLAQSDAELYELFCVVDPPTPPCPRLDILESLLPSVCKELCKKGMTSQIYPPGKAPREVEVFIAILGCSLLTYVEAVESQCKEGFITACEQSLPPLRASV